MKYKGIPLEVKPWYWNIIPTLAWCGASAQYSKIILRKDIYRNVLSNRPSPVNIALLEHEAKHIERQQRIGRWKFQLYYQFFPKFRIYEELVADYARFKYLKKHNIKYNLDQRAKMLSSWKYMWGVSYKDVKKELNRLYKEA